MSTQPDISQLFNLQPGERIVVEIEKLCQDDGSCMSCAITAKDPDKKVVIEDYFRITRIDKPDQSAGYFIHGPDSDLVEVMASNWHEQLGVDQ